MGRRSERSRGGKEEQGEMRWTRTAKLSRSEIKKELREKEEAASRQRRKNNQISESCFRRGPQRRQGRAKPQSPWRAT